MQKPKPTILFVGEAVTLAHVLRPWGLARGLNPAHFDIHFATDARAGTVLANWDGATRWHLKSADPATFLKRLAKAQPVVDAKTLNSQVLDDLELISLVRPSLVVGDFRLSLSVSARVAGVPFATITNAHWHPACQQAPPMPDLPVHRIMPRSWVQPMFDRFIAHGFKAHAKPMNEVRRKWGMSPLPDIRHGYTDADTILVADHPDLVSPMVSNARNTQMIGPIPWTPQAPTPTWLSSLGDRPMVYVCLGSSGDVSQLTELLEALAGLDADVVCATAGRIDLETLPMGVFGAPYLDGSKMAAMADLVIGNGGAAGAYQALSQGTPLLGIPTNMDQYFMMRRVVQAGAGRCIPGGEAKPASVAKHVKALLGCTETQGRAQALGQTLRAWDAASAFQPLVERFRTKQPIQRTQQLGGFHATA